MPDTYNPATDEIINEGTRRINGQLMTWQPNDQIQAAMDYLGIDREQAARMNGYTGDMADIDKPGVGAGGWVPASYDHPGGQLGKILALTILGGAGGAAAAGTLPALFGAGAAAGGAGAGGAALPVSTGLTAAQAAALPGSVAGGLGLGATTGLTAGAASALPGAVGGSAAGGVTTGLPVSTGLSASTASTLPGATTAGSGGGMNWLGTIKNIFGIGSGKGSTTADLVRTGLDVAGDISKGRAAERAQENADLEADYLAKLKQYQIDSGNALASFAAPSGRAAQTALGDVLANWKPLAYDESGKLTGGLSPALFGDNTRAAGQALSKQALDALLSGNPAGLPTAPVMPERLSATGVDTVLNILGTGGKALGAYNAITDARDERKQKADTIQTLVDLFNGKNSSGGGGSSGASSGGAKPGATTGGDVALHKAYIDDNDVDPYAGRSASFHPAAVAASQDQDLVNMPVNRRTLGRGVTMFGTR